MWIYWREELAVLWQYRRSNPVILDVLESYVTNVEDLLLCFDSPMYSPFDAISVDDNPR